MKLKKILEATTSSNMTPKSMTGTGKYKGDYQEWLKRVVVHGYQTIDDNDNPLDGIHTIKSYGKANNNEEGNSDKK